MKSLLPDVAIPELALHEVILKRAESYGDKQALICAETGCSYTYRQLAHFIRAVASGLVKAGVTTSTKVAILSPNVPEWAFFLFGVIAAGGTATTINPNYTANEIAQQLKLVNSTMIITIPGYEKQIDEAILRIPSNQIRAKFMLGTNVAPGYIPFSKLMQDDGSSYPAVNFNIRDHVAAILFSSGTTGLPKGVMLTHYNIVANIHQNQRVFFPPSMNLYNPNKANTTMAVLPFFHSFGFSKILTLQLSMGLTLITMRRFQPELFLETIQKYKIAGMTIVPPIVLFLAKDPRVTKYDVSSVKATFTAAAPSSAQLLKEYKARIPGEVIQGYGLTESSPSLVGAIYGKRIEIGSSGYLIPNTEMKVLDRETGREITEPGVRGELLFRGPQIMKGYYNNPEATATTIDKEGWLHTGDIGYFSSIGNIYVVDRVKELIKYKGFQVAPAELEGILLSHPSISDAAVFGIPDEAAGELPRAHVVFKPGREVDLEEIHSHVKENAANFKQLRGGIIVTDQIPKSASGKILRRELRELAKKSKL